MGRKNSHLCNVYCKEYTSCAAYRGESLGIIRGPGHFEKDGGEESIDSGNLELILIKKKAKFSD